MILKRVSLVLGTLLLLSIILNFYLYISRSDERLSQDATMTRTAAVVGRSRAEDDFAKGLIRVLRHVGVAKERDTGQVDGVFAVWEYDALSNRSGRRRLSSREHELKQIFGQNHMVSYNAGMQQLASVEEAAP